MPLVLVGGLATAVFLCGAVAQLVVGRLVERFPPHILFAGDRASCSSPACCGPPTRPASTLLLALAVAMAAIYGQVTVNDVVIARYTADAWRGRVYAVRYFLTFLVVGRGGVGDRHSSTRRGGFDLVLGVTALIALGFVVATAADRGAGEQRREGARAVPQPAE